MQDTDKIDFLLIFSDMQFSPPDIDKNGWASWWNHPKKWVFEWMSDDGIEYQLDGADSDILKWNYPQWHIYPPCQAYRVKYKHFKRKHENTWMLFSISGEPPLPLNKCTVIEDPELRLLRFARQMYKVQEAGFRGHENLLKHQLLTILEEIKCALSNNKKSECGNFMFPLLDQPETGKEQKKTLLEKLDSILLSNLRSPPNVYELAKLMNISVSSLSHRFKKESGWTIVERIRWLRIQEAKKMLARGDMNIKTAAAKLGFKNQYYFSRVFKESSGMNPTDFVT